MTVFYIIFLEESIDLLILIVHQSFEFFPTFNSIPLIQNTLKVIKTFLNFIFLFHQFILYIHEGQIFISLCEQFVHLKHCFLFLIYDLARELLFYFFLVH